jgi:hypothetical protein
VVLESQRRPAGHAYKGNRSRGISMSVTGKQANIGHVTESVCALYFQEESYCARETRDIEFEKL